MKKELSIYRFFDDHEEKHYVITSFTRQQLEELLEKYKTIEENVYALEFIKYLHEFDSEAEEVQVKDFYF